ncbi:hypothetical protein RND81_09G148000 [Saponaria officinalis]|uniref:Uncharacterized protein n=1 Tax=Saponaria officinalis TaxID=3572 RepID=A0AAW1IMX1_SAPOF
MGACVRAAPAQSKPYFWPNSVVIHYFMRMSYSSCTSGSPTFGPILTCVLELEFIPVVFYIICNKFFFVYVIFCVDVLFFLEFTKVKRSRIFKRSLSFLLELK